MTRDIADPSDQKLPGARRTEGLSGQNDGTAVGSISTADPLGRFLKIGEVSVEIGLSRAQIYRLMKDPKHPFPPPIKIGSASRWAFAEIESWKQDALRRRNAQPPSNKKSHQINGGGGVSRSKSCRSPTTHVPFT